MCNLIGINKNQTYLFAEIMYLIQFAGFFLKKGPTLLSVTLGKKWLHFLSYLFLFDLSFKMIQNGVSDW